MDDSRQKLEQISVQHSWFVFFPTKVTKYRLPSEVWNLHPGKCLGIDKRWP